MLRCPVEQLSLKVLPGWSLGSDSDTFTVGVHICEHVYVCAGQALSWVFPSFFFFCNT